MARRDVDPALLPERMRASPRVAPLLDAANGEERLWLVGGAVRDLLLGGEPVDLDLVVEGDAAAAAARLAARLGGEVRGHERFGTASVRAGSLGFDLATARSERYPRPGALPVVAPASLDEDLPRRDFTVNALAAALGGPRPGELRAPPRALDDLRAGALRVFHRRSFLDDPTRLVRLVRYAARLGFAPESATERRAEEALAGRALATVSGPRIGAELRLLLAEPAALAALGQAERLGLLGVLGPGLSFDEALAAAALDLAKQAGAGAPGDAPLAVLGTLARGLDRADLRAWLDDLGFEAPARDAVVAAALDAPALAERLATARRPSEIAAAARRAPDAAVAVAGALGPREQARRWLTELRDVRLEIGGRDLVAAGVPEGPAVGRALEAALRAKLDGEVAGREGELRAALAAS